MQPVHGFLCVPALHGVLTLGSELVCCLVSQHAAACVQEDEQAAWQQLQQAQHATRELRSLEHS